MGVQSDDGPTSPSSPTASNPLNKKPSDTKKLVDELRHKAEVSEADREEAMRLLEELKASPKPTAIGKSKSKPLPKLEGKFSPFTSFPTPNLLVQAQREYAAQDHKHEVDADGVPEPFPTPTPKGEAFNNDAYHAVDVLASSVPKDVASGTLKSVVDYLVEGTSDDMGKIRAFFVWIASVDDQEHKIIYDTQLDNALNKAMMCRANCFSYNKLLESMCNLANIPCNIVEGAAKGFENEDDEEFALDTHHWCMVYVDGAWRLIDQCFGSEYVVRDMVDWEIQNPDQPNPAEQKESAKMHYIGEEHFLTDPELFIYKHFPAEQQNQLLARPVTHQEFNSMTVINKSYFDCGFEDISETKSKIESKNGEVRLWFKLPAKSNVIMNFALFKHFHESSSQKIGNLNDQVRLQTKGGKKEMWIFFHHVGIYKLQILVREDESSQIRELVRYLINCKYPYLPAIDNPPLALGLQEIGPGAAWRKLGISTGLEEGIIKAKDGRVTLKLKCSTDIVFSFHLKKEDSGEQIPQCVITEQSTEGTTAYIKMPSHGTYLLKVFTGHRTDKALQHTCNFLIESDIKCVDPPFPEVFQTVGSVNECGLLKPLKGGAYLTLSGKLDDFVIEAQIMQDAFYLMKLALWDGKQETDLSEFVCYEKVEDKLRILCRFKHAGNYLLRIFTKTDPEEKAFGLSWKYLLEVENPTYEYQAYPEKLKDWTPELILKSPKYKFLGQQMDYMFEVDVPGAKKVKVMKIGEQKTTTLKKTGAKTYMGKVNTLVEQAQMVLYAEVDNDQVKQFWKFDIINADRIGELEVEYHLQEEEAEVKKAMLEEELSQQKDEAKERKKKALEKESKRKRDFESKQDELLAREEKLEENVKGRKLLSKLMLLHLNTGTLNDMFDTIDDDKDTHKVIITMLLFFGESEDKTEDVEYCKTHVRGKDRKKLLDEMLTFKPDKVHPEIMARAKQVLRQTNWLALKETNVSAGKVFEWAKEIMDAYRGDVSVSAANTKRQQQIFSAS